MNEKYCPNCEQYVKPEKENFSGGGIGCLFPVVLLILGALLGPVGIAGASTIIVFMVAVSIVTGIIGTVVYAAKDPHCPICNTNNLYDSKELYEKSEKDTAGSGGDFLENYGDK